MSILSRPRGYMLLAVIIMATALAGCMTPSTLPAPAPALPQADEGIVTMYVGPTQADCVGEGPQKCLLVKEGSADGPYLMFYNNIKGFDYEEGYHYELRVRKTNVENPPAGGSSIAYELVEVVSKTPAGEVSTLYVAPMMVECETTEIYKCLLVADSPDGEYRPFYGKISGFDYEEGYQYSLLVEAVAMDQPPSDAPAGVWNLLAVTRKEPATAAVAAAPQQNALEGTLWVLTSYAGADGQMRPILAGSEVSATFQDGRVVGNAGCNNYTASYILDGNALVIGPAATTMMACISAEVMAQETAYLNALADVAEYQVTDQTLHLLNGDGAITLEYAASMPATLTGATWQVTMVNNGKEAVVSVAADTTLTMTFSEDGQVSGSAGCNNFMGGYTVNGDAITIGPLASTMMMCATDGVMEQEQMFLTALSTATTYAISGDKLELRTATGALAVSAIVQPAETAAAPEASLNAPLEGTLWTLTSYLNAQGEMTAPIAGAEPTATFMDGRVSGNASCNNYSADYTVDGDSLKIGLAVSTMMMCQPEAVAAQEQAYMAALATVATYQIEGDTLSLMNEAGETVLVYGATQPATLTGTTWQVTMVNNGKEAVVGVIADTALTMTFGEDGQLSGSAGCNNFSGGYTVDGDAITVGPLASTMMMCVEPENIMEQEAQFLTALQAATVYTIQGDVLELRNDTGALQVSATVQPMDASTAAPAEASLNAPLEGTLWTLTSYLNAQGETVAPIAGAVPTATFVDGRVSGNASCNNYSADYTVDGNSMEIGLGVSTMMMCQPEAVAAQEQAYMAALARVASFEIVGESLALADGEGNVLLSYEALQPTSLTETPWQVGFYNNGKQALVSPLAGSAITLLFGADGNVSGSAGCNNFAGGYTLEGDQLTIGPLAATMMMCADPEGIMDQEMAFMAALQSTATYQITGDVLELLDANGARAVVASSETATPAADAAAQSDAAALPTEQTLLAGPVWAWQSLDMSDGSITTVKNPEQYTIEFMDDGTLNVQADCNMAGGAYAEENGALRIEVAAMTRKACPPGSLSDEFVARLNQVATYVMDGGKLYLNLKMDSGNLVFAPLAAAEARATQPTAEPTPAPIAEPTAAPALVGPTNGALIVGPTWQWAGFQDGAERYAVAQPERYTITFLPTGKYEVKADCNTGSGSYTLDGKNLTIGPAALTRMACPPDSQSAEFLKNLDAAKWQFVVGKSLYITTTDGGVMKLVRTR